MQSEVHFVGAEEEREAAGGGAGDVVGSRSVLGIVRGVDVRLPTRVADGLRVKNPGLANFRKAVVLPISTHGQAPEKRGNRPFEVLELNLSGFLCRFKRSMQHHLV